MLREVEEEQSKNHQSKMYCLSPASPTDVDFVAVGALHYINCFTFSLLVVEVILYVSQVGGFFALEKVAII